MADVRRQYHQSAFGIAQRGSAMLWEGYVKEPTCKFNSVPLGLNESTDNTFEIRLRCLR